MARIALANSSFSFLPQGAIIQEFHIAGRNLVISFPRQELYPPAHYFGETIGRVANRISGGLIEDLNGRSYQLDKNLDGINHLHGGTSGWGTKTFSGPQEVERLGRKASYLTYISPDGDQGYPGAVELRVWYTASEENNGVVSLEVEYEAELIDDICSETIVNVTNHSYFNLGEGPTVDGTSVEISTNDYIAVDDCRLPTGDIAVFPGLNPHQPFVLGADEPQIDHCFVVNKNDSNTPVDTRMSKPNKLVHAFHPSTGIHLEVLSTEPAFQFYTGDYVDVPASEEHSRKMPRAGFCVEPGRFINAVNIPSWREQVVLRRGQKWGSRTIYKAWKA